jgi:ketosteroid isomerase-like protein
MKAAATAMAGGDMPGFLESFAEDATWTVPGNSPLAGRYEGRDGIGRFFSESQDRAGSPFVPAPIEAVASDEHLALFLRVTGDRPGADLNVTIAHFATVNAAGLFVHNWFLPDDQEAFDAFLA